MKKLLLLSILCLAGCVNWTPKQKAAATTAMDFGVNLVQYGVDIFAQVITARAQSGADLNSKANWSDSVAGGLRSLETSSNGLVTASDVETVVRQFTDPNKVHWSDLADNLAAAFAKDPAPTNVKLEALAASANISAANQRALAGAMGADPDSLITLPSDSQP